MPVDPLVLRNKLLEKLNAAGFDTSSRTQDYWYSIAKALCLEFGSGGGGTVSHPDTTNRDAANSHPGTAINLSTTNFNHNLSTADSTVQHAMDTIDDLAIPVADDHKVKADSSDTAPAELQGKLINGSHIAWTLDTTGGNRRMRADVTIPAVSVPTAAVTSPLADGIADPGLTTSGEYQAKSHVHPLHQAEGQLFYSAFVPSSFWKEPVATVFKGAAACYPTPFSGWTQTSPGVWVRDDTGTVPISHSDNIELLANMRVLVWGPGALATTTKYFGIYVVDNPGAVGEHAEMHRALDLDTSEDFYDGIFVYVSGGDTYGGNYYNFDSDNTFILDTSVQVWVEWTETPPALGLNYMLPWQDIDLASSSTIIASATVTESETVLGDFPFYHVQQPVLGRGVWTFYCRAWVTANDGSSVNKIRVDLKCGDLWTPIAETASITALTPTTYTVLWYNTTSIDTLFSPQSYILRYVAVSNSINGVEINLETNSTNHYTSVQTGFYANQNNHEDLVGRDDLAQHPAKSITVEASGFLGVLSAADDTVQRALMTIDSLPVVSESVNGLAPLVTNTANYLRGDGAWADPILGLSLLTTAYEVDYNAVENQDIKALGAVAAVTIDGKVYYTGNATSCTTFGVGPTYGGLYIKSSATSINDNGNVLTAPFIGCALNIAGIYGLADLSPGAMSKELWIWVMAAPVTTFTANYDRAIIGFGWGANNYGGLSTLSFRVRQAFMYTTGISPSNFGQHVQICTPPNSSDATKNWQVGDIGTYTDVNVFHVRGSRVDSYYGTSMAGAWPSRTSLIYAGTTTSNEATLAGGISSTHLYPIIWYSIANQNTNAKADILVKKLKLECSQFV